MSGDENVFDNSGMYLEMLHFGKGSSFGIVADNSFDSNKRDSGGGTQGTGSGLFPGYNPFQPSTSGPTQTVDAVRTDLENMILNLQSQRDDLAEKMQQLIDMEQRVRMEIAKLYPKKDNLMGDNHEAS